MRASIIAFIAAPLVVFPALASPLKQERAVERIPVEAGERYHDRWQGRQHWLFDETYTERQQTDGRSAACVVRPRPSNGIEGAGKTERSEACDE